MAAPWQNGPLQTWLGVAELEYGFHYPQSMVNGKKLFAVVSAKVSDGYPALSPTWARARTSAIDSSASAQKSLQGSIAFSGVLEHDLIGEPSRLVPKDSLCERQRGVDRGQAAFAAPLEGWQLGCEGVSV